MGEVAPVPAQVMPADAFVVRPAVAADVPAMAAMLQAYGARELLLPRTEAELHPVLNEFAVCEHDGVVVGMGALHVYTPELGELRSIAVREGCQRHGLGGQLVHWQLARARECGLARVFALTYRVRFFERLGFRRMPRASLPEKVWGDCFRCPKAEHCDEVAVVRRVGTAEADVRPSGVL